MTVELYILAGQSNAGGNGELTELSSFTGTRVRSLDMPQHEALFSINYHNGPMQNNTSDRLHHGGFVPLVPGQSELNGRHPDLFGPEVSFLDRMSCLREAPLALMKYYVNGASLVRDFNPASGSAGGGAFQGLMKSLDAAGRWMRSHRKRFSWKGMLWFQGETDAEAEALALAYEVNLSALLQAVRRRVRNPGLPVVIFQTQNLRGAWTKTVRSAQARVARSNPMTDLIDTTPQRRHMRDHVHYRGAAHVAFGRKGAERMHALLEKRSR